MIEVSYNELVEKVNEFLSLEFEVDSAVLVADANMKETLELDSLDYVDLVVMIENNFGIKINPEDFVNLVTFQDFYTFLQERVSSN